jgi:hypothetical protein
MPRVGWFTSSYTNGHGCVEVKFEGDLVHIRDTKYLRDPANDPATNPIITLPAIKWKWFLEKVLDPTVDAVPGTPAIELDRVGGASLRAADGATLVYNEVEWTAFKNGITDREFLLALA